MNWQEYKINDRALTYFSSLTEEFSIQQHKNYLFDLSCLSVLGVEGTQTDEFLQGQLSCDIRQVTPEAMRQGAICNLKGRVLALLDVLNWQGFKLVLPKDLLGSTQASLNKAAMLSRVKLEPQTNYRVYGFLQNNVEDLTLKEFPLSKAPYGLTNTDSACCYHLDNNFYILLVPEEQISWLSQPFLEAGQLRGSLSWHQLRLKHKELAIYPDTRGLFLPHRLDLHRSGYLSFDKGCYKGQEIVARTHYRAKLKHQLALFTIETKEELRAGKKLFNESDAIETGELIDYCPLSAQQYLIAASIFFEHNAQTIIEGHAYPVLLNPL